MNDKSCEKMEKIYILNDSQKERVHRQITVYGSTGGTKDYLVDSLLQALAIAFCESNMSSIEGIKTKKIAELSDTELLETFPYQFKPNSIQLNCFSVWKYN